MVKIEFKEPDTPVWKRWRRDCATATTKVVSAVREGEKPDIRNIYKRANIKQSFYMSIDGPFHGKCAYCETLIVADQYGDIEHFRPARAVTDELGKPITFTKGHGEVLEHPGYYWLAYDISNLLPSCELCNRPNPKGIEENVVGKHNKFPLKQGSHATSPGNEANEEPLLINPIHENPENHLKVDFKTFMFGGDDRGQCCIRIFGLNIRPGLAANRRTAYQATLSCLNKYINSVDEKETKECLDELCDIVAGKKPYSFIGRAIIKSKFPSFFGDLEGMVSSI
ncbi:MAG: hypothetical protein PHU44_00055 [Syntrophales bacterium]|nr:hypothetical protein [Syntrophales bacterium]